ncbi:COMPASS component [Komagataella phaffii]
MMVPSHDRSTALIGSLCAHNVFRHFELLISQTLIASSDEPLINRFPLWLNFTQFTWYVCPTRVFTHLKDSMDHILTVVSSDADAKYLPSSDQLKSDTPNV